MSEQTKAALEAAIQEHVASENAGEYTAAWVLVTGGVQMAGNDTNTVWIENPENQANYVSLGLLDAGNILLRGFTYAVMTKHQIEEED